MSTPRTRAQHNARVAGVGAGGDGRQDHTSMLQGVLPALEDEGGGNVHSVASQAIALETHLQHK